MIQNKKPGCNKKSKNFVKAAVSWITKRKDNWLKKRSYKKQILEKWILRSFKINPYSLQWWSKFKIRKIKFSLEINPEMIIFFKIYGFEKWKWRIKIKKFITINCITAFIITKLDKCGFIINKLKTILRASMYDLHV